MSTRFRKILSLSAITLISIGTLSGCSIIEELSPLSAEKQQSSNKDKYEPHPRVLKNTFAFIGEPTVYNVANTKMGDKCAWDYNSDDSIDLEDDCNVIEYIHTSKKAKMSVTVTDISGEKYHFTHKTKLFEKPEM